MNLYWKKALPLLPFLALIVFMTSCKDNAELLSDTTEVLTTEEATVQALTVMESSGEMGCSGCFELVFPVTIELPDESQVVVESREDIRDAIALYLEDNPPTDGRPFRPFRRFRPAVVFPYEVQLEDGSILLLESEEDLAAVLEDCGFNPNRPQGPGWNGSHGQHGGLHHCFNLVFPVTVNFPDGTSLEVADREALATAFGDWRMNNPDADERPVLAYPYDVELQDGTVVTVASDEDREALREECGGRVGGGHGQRCIEVQYPVTIAFPDGTSEEVNSREEKVATVMEWRNANPDSEARPELVFPITVTVIADESTAEVNSREELRELRRSCH